MIDREKLMTTLQYRINEARNKGSKVTTIFISTLSDCMTLLKEQEAVVRCKDCKNMKVLPCDIHGHIPIYCTNLGIYSEGLDWFCADGERRDSP